METAELSGTNESVHAGNDRRWESHTNICSILLHQSMRFCYWWLYHESELKQTHDFYFTANIIEQDDSLNIHEECHYILKRSRIKYAPRRRRRKHCTKPSRVPCLWSVALWNRTINEAVSFIDESMFRLRNLRIWHPPSKYCIPSAWIR